MKTEIYIKGAQEHNLKNIDVRLPRNKLIVITGVSGSGKSSLAFDTLYAEGQRRYVESLSAYARQFLGQMEKPKIDYIEGLSPAISIEQKAASKNPRSTVGTVTEIYDYLRVLYARIGKQYCYNCGDLVGAQTVDQLTDHILENKPGTRLQVLAPIVQNRKGEHIEELEEARKEGFVRVKINGKMRDLSEDIKLDKKSKHNIEIVVDRIGLKEGIRSRLFDSVETALRLTDGFIKIDYVDEKREENLSESNSCSRCSIGYPQLSPQHFSFNSPVGMCKTCNGLGTTMELDPDLIVPDKKLSIMQGAVVPWGNLSKKKSSWQIKKLKAISHEYDFSLQTPWNELPKQIQALILHGSKGRRIKFEWQTFSGNGTFFSKFNGVIPTLRRRMNDTKSEYMRRYYMQFIGNKPCPDCDGKKLRKESLAVKINDKTIDVITKMSISEAINFFHNIELLGNDKIIAEEVLKEINNRLSFLVNVGLHYLSLERSAPTLSGGESQRIRLASQIGSSLVGVMYILDEPSIGLHQRDNKRLINMLLHLRDLGNTVIVVEHDEEMIRTADQIVDFGPRAGIYGGEIIYQGDLKGIIQDKNSLTGKYLSGKLKIDVPESRQKADFRILKIEGAGQNNLKNIDVEIPVGLFNCVTGVSGSGKSSLINQILYPATAKLLNKSNVKVGAHKSIEGLENFDKVINIDQQPIGRTPRSNPATYIKLFDPIRQLFSNLPASKLRGYNPGRFSFNVKGGRCESCGGAGVRQIEMHFLPDIFVTCETCKGLRYNKETLAVKFKGYSISDILNLDVQEALEVFDKIPKIKKKLLTLQEVGLDYIKLGQASTTLSGGEAQRIKLSRELSKTSTGKTLYILDEPTTGLHFDDIKKLLKVLQKLAALGNTIVVIEHNLDVIKCADHIIDLGPEGGDNGGKIVAAGTPEEVAGNKNSFTGKFLKKVLK
ncbi:MAG: excinuclease ABC subunit UvrA [Candidatus Cloacimonetes bacterium]|nr:excinuclease ABC subunit UvrA [Candidatus Cloacimonadota bacterium]MCF7814648.1 excinuclease ABC subunit UvrA [Candidatus Cloacimonadota bacterium]MCF7869115.1 excinuclease ABC subunit UvrA [Candidatus Cloacimonadota bacterium]MCF7884522.1 excinuclease ABC subunit UvrA [Candidatus Cloacimonadota bacterium]